MKKFRIVSFVVLTVAAFFSNELLAQNTLTKAEEKAGWKLLFDGKTAKGWHTYNAKTLGQGWKVAGGVLYLDSSVKEGSCSRGWPTRLSLADFGIACRPCENRRSRRSPAH